jgi:hypothetical protein
MHRLLIFNKPKIVRERLSTPLCNNINITNNDDKTRMSIATDTLAEQRPAETN